MMRCEDLPRLLPPFARSFVHSSEAKLPGSNTFLIRTPENVAEIKRVCCLLDVLDVKQGECKYIRSKKNESSDCKRLYVVLQTVTFMYESTAGRYET